MKHTTKRRLLAGASATTALLVAAAGTATSSVAAPNNNNSEKLRKAVTVEGISDHLRALQSFGDANGGNRYAGLPGYDVSAQYVFDTLKASGYSPTFQEFTYFGFRENAPTTLSQVSPTPTTYTGGTDFSIMSFSGGGDVTGTLAQPSGAVTGCDGADFSAFPAGTIALVSRGTCSFRAKATNAIGAGAAGVIIYNSADLLLSGTLGDGGLAGAPVVGTTKALGQALLAEMASGPVTVKVTTDVSGGLLRTRNVIAELPGSDAGENVVMVGAHLDSVAVGPGINDNGSGSATILEVAEQLAKTKPRNTVRFAWWSAEESGLIGSTRYVESLTQAEQDTIALYLNFDMVGSPNFARFVYDGDNSAFPVGPGSEEGPAGSGAIEALFASYFASAGLESEPTAFSGRSDYGPFIEVGIPAGGLFTGAEGIKTPAQAAKFGGTAGTAYDPCYHQACDTFDNVNMTGLDQMSDAVAHAVITYAQNTSSVNGVKGKGNVKRAPAGSTSGSGTTSGGGLDDDHDLVAS